MSYSAANWPPMVAPLSEPSTADVQAKASKGSWVVLTFSYHTRRWDRWCAFPTLAKADYYCDGKFGDGPTQRIVRVTKAGKLSKVVHRGRADQL